MTTPEALQGELNAALARLSEALSQKASLEAALIENHKLASEQINEKHRILTETRGTLAAANARADAAEAELRLYEEDREKLRISLRDTIRRAETVESALAAARLHLGEATVDALHVRQSLRRMIDVVSSDGDERRPMRAAVAREVAEARKALTAPASAAGEEGK